MMSRVYHTCCSKMTHDSLIIKFFFCQVWPHYGMNQNLKLDEVYSRLFCFFK
jgi:hypothetical protein